jgi:hypothetical protein
MKNGFGTLENWKSPLQRFLLPLSDDVIKANLKKSLELYYEAGHRTLYWNGQCASQFTQFELKVAKELKLVIQIFT